MNTVILKGRLGQDPELKEVGNDKKVVNFSIATNDGTKEKPKTNWNNCSAWGRTAEVINQYFKKGDEIMITGAIDYQKPEAVTYTKINVFRFEFCGNRSEIPAEIQSDGGADDNLPF